MASEPYWAAAPSRRISMRSTAALGMALRSTPTVPRPKVPLTCTRALEWRRLPLISTSTWSGPRPRRLAGLMWSVPSAMVWWDALKEGANWRRVWLISVWPDWSISRAEMMSTGAGVSTAVRTVARAHYHELVAKLQNALGELEIHRHRFSLTDPHRLLRRPVADEGGLQGMIAGSHLELEGSVRCP